MKGFTLIELLVVVLIIGILSAVALPQYTKAVNKARLSEVWTTLKSLNDAISIAEMESGTLPASFDELAVAFVDASGRQATGSSFSTKYFTYQIDSSLNGRSYGLARSADWKYTFNILDGKRYCWDNNKPGECKKYGFSKHGVGCTSGAGPYLSDNNCYVD
ncbi:MAG: prepilin-type N-terminal cleavage/methylation domain-containing protein [Elusimicrobiaceae bacterium]|nr:prepilin-type N-terminal cleavage/methylation domain-containing protein [Elusimicrobiaceae bacterium]